MSSKQKTLIGGVGIALLLLLVGFAYSWISDGSIRKVADLQGQLLNAHDLPQEEFNALKLSLMRTVDTMPRDKVREMYEKMGEERREQERQNREAFFAAANDLEKDILLDRVIDEKKRSREIQGALRTGGMFRRRKTTKEDKERMAEMKKIREEMDAGNLTKEEAGEKFKALWGDRNRGPKLSEEERAAREEQRRMQNEFNDALAARAEQTGVELPSDRGRGRGIGGGRPGGGRGGAGGGRANGGGRPRSTQG